MISRQKVHDTLSKFVSDATAWHYYYFFFFLISLDEGKTVEGIKIIFLGYSKKRPFSRQTTSRQKLCQVGGTVRGAPRQRAWSFVLVHASFIFQIRFNPPSHHLFSYLAQVLYVFSFLYFPLFDFYELKRKNNKYCFLSCFISYYFP